MDFTTLGLADSVVQALAALGIATPLPIQRLAIPVLLQGSSAMLHAQTGSGKTLAYVLPLLASINPDLAKIQGVILAPTHELAMQIFRVLGQVIKHSGLPVRTQSLIGGAATSRQLDGLKKKPHIVVGSAGRMAHLLDLGKLALRDTGMLVVDEADQMLIDEHMPQIRRVTKELSPQARYVFVSATERPAATHTARLLAPDLNILRVQEERISPSIQHMILLCEEREKIDLVRKLVRGLGVTRTLVFVHKGPDAQRMRERLAFHGLTVADLHGAQDKFARQAALEGFRAGQTSVLIASDIAARGLDIANVDLVINADPPSQSREYIHRAGRTGRAGASGRVLTLLQTAELRLTHRYVHELGVTIEHVRLERGQLVPAVLHAEHTRPNPSRTRTAQAATAKHPRPKRPKRTA
ncbi:DEAD/DEAH box helicase [Desulfovibrionales bacterium]